MVQQYNVFVRIPSTTLRLLSSTNVRGHEARKILVGLILDLPLSASPAPANFRGANATKFDLSVPQRGHFFYAFKAKKPLQGAIARNAAGRAD